MVTTPRCSDGERGELLNHENTLPGQVHPLAAIDNTFWYVRPTIEWCPFHHLEGLFDVLRLLSLFQPRLNEADPLRTVIRGDVQDTSATDSCRRGVLQVSNLEDHPHMRLPALGFGSKFGEQ